MPEGLAGLVEHLDLEFGWKRVRIDRPERVFFTPAHTLDWVESDLSNWLEIVARHIRNGYAPKPSQTWFVPKPGWLVRPGCVPDLQDEIIYNAVLATLRARRNGNRARCNHRCAGTNGGQPPERVLRARGGRRRHGAAGH